MTHPIVHSREENITFTKENDAASERKRANEREREEEKKSGRKGSRGFESSQL